MKWFGIITVMFIDDKTDKSDKKKINLAILKM